MASFTPGPWSYSENAYGAVFVHGGKTLTTSVGTEYKELIAGGNSHNTLTIANARLIAAAPDLLKAAKAAIAQIDAVGLPDDEVTSLFRASLSKAEPHHPHTAEKVTQGGKSE